MAALDTVVRLETPEGVVLELPVAGPLPRALAWVVDLTLRMVAYTMAATVFGALGDAGMGLLMVAVFLLEWLYPVIFEVKSDGVTPGKAALGLAVVMDDGTPVTPAASLIRNLLRAADLLPMGYAVGLLTMTVDPGFRRLGDMAAGTLVVHRERSRPPAALPPADPVAVPVALSAEEQRLLVEFAARSATWGQERSEELAELLQPLAGGPPPTAVARLRGMARWLQGAR